MITYLFQLLLVLNHEYAALGVQQDVLTGLGSVCGIDSCDGAEIKVHILL
jgi:hypothetical protein